MVMVVAAKYSWWALGESAPQRTCDAAGAYLTQQGRRELVRLETLS